MGTTKSRRMKIDWFRSKLLQAKKKGIEIRLDSLLSLFAVECFSTQRTGLEILKDMDFAKEIPPLVLDRKPWVQK